MPGLRHRHSPDRVDSVRLPEDVMKKISKLSVIPLLFGLLLTAVAQDQSSAQAKLQQLSAQLNLTPDQKEKLKPILQDEAQQMQTVRDDTSLTKQQKWSKSREIQQSFQPKVNAVLTPEQQDKLKQMKQQAIQQMREKKNSAIPQN